MKAEPQCSKAEPHDMGVCEKSQQLCRLYKHSNNIPLPQYKQRFILVKEWIDAVPTVEVALAPFL